MSVHDHLESIAAQAGLEVMGHVLSIVADREQVPVESLLALGEQDVTELYEGFVARAVDRVERSLLGEFGP